jgi:phosphoribosyl 1,2-cyclic phosphate phosphodiesterase
VCQSDDSHDKRLRSSAMVEVDGVRILIDAGPDFRQQMLREGVKDLDAILLTHEHKDHVGGLDDVRAFNYVLKRPMDIYALERVLGHLKVEFSYVFSEKPYPGVPQMALHPIGNEPITVKGV